ncbi:MAG: hypothetical protein L0Y64_02910 [Myxococcaceae bacterium]|nr:hypothetical protein [Myxococcaceae bacterium]
MRGCTTPSPCPSPRGRGEIKALLAGSLLFAAGCGRPHCEPPSPERLALLPERLSETGLFQDVQAEVLAPGVRPFAPRFQLWSDGASKRRWVFLPPGTRIDSSDMDAWQFPQGTKLWKEFTRDGVRVETRLLQKVGPAAGDWVAVAYLWDEDGRDAHAVPEGQEDARGTPHDVPSAGDCRACHDGRPGRVLGFSALQLSHAAPPGGLHLQELTSEGLLSSPPAGPFSLPGDATEQAALGYLHANCSHCHNSQRPADAPGCFVPPDGEQLDFLLQVDRLDDVHRTRTYQTAVGTYVQEGTPEDSWLFQRVSSRASFLGFRLQMPPLGTEMVDGEGVAGLRSWIEGL